MDFLENVMSAVGSAAQTVVKKSGEVVEYSKLKYSMFDLSNSIKICILRLVKQYISAIKIIHPRLMKMLKINVLKLIN